MKKAFFGVESVQVRSLSLSGDLRVLFVGGPRMLLKADLARSAVVGWEEIPEYPLKLALMPEETHLLVGCLNPNRLLLFSAATLRRVGVFEAHSGAVAVVHPLSRRGFVVTASSDESLAVWSLDGTQLGLKFRVKAAGVRVAKSLPGSDTFFTADERGKLVEWNALEEKPRKSIQLGDELFSLRLDHQARFLLVEGRNSFVIADRVRFAKVWVLDFRMCVFGDLQLSPRRSSVAFVADPPGLLAHPLKSALGNIEAVKSKNLLEMHRATGGALLCVPQDGCLQSVFPRYSSMKTFYSRLKRRPLSIFREGKQFRFRKNSFSNPSQNFSSKYQISQIHLFPQNPRSSLVFRLRDHQLLAHPEILDFSSRTFSGAPLFALQLGSQEFLGPALLWTQNGPTTLGQLVYPPSEREIDLLPSARKP